jgi:nucleoside-diphosphate-sugar epimerase
MDVLITGATGYIGGAVAAALQRAGHEVHAVTHTAESRSQVRARGWHSVAGDLRDGEALERAAAGMDAVIHAANTGGADAAVVDTNATRTFLRAFRGTGRPFIYTSGAWVLGGGASDESSSPDPTPLVAWRGTLEREVVAAAPDIRAVVIRPGIVYGRGGGIPGMIARGELPVIGDGGQRWPLVYIDDLADLYVRALAAPAGSILHGISATLAMRQVAQMAGAGAPTLPLADARERLGAFADALALDQQVSSRATRELLGWQPRGPSPAVDLPAATDAPFSAPLNTTAASG